MPATLWFAEQVVNTTTAGDQFNATITRLNNGTFVVVWQDNGVGSGDIKGQLYTAAGVRIGGEIIIASGAAVQETPEVVATSAGGFRVVWEVGITGFQRFYDSTGTALGAGAQVYNDVNDTRSLVNPDGSFVDTFVFNNDIWITRRNSAGSGLGDTLVTSTTAGNQTDPDIARLNDSNYIVVWTTPGLEVRGRLVDSAGVVQGAGDFVISDANISSVANSRATVTALSNGGFVVAWVTVSATFPGSGRDIKYQVFTPAGNVFTGELFANLDTASNQSSPEILALADGGFMITWQDEIASDIRGQLFNGLGNPNGNTFQISTNTASTSGAPRILSAVLLEDGRVAVAFTGAAVVDDNSGVGIRLQIIDPREGVVTGSDIANTLSGGQVADQISGLGGSDTLFGLAGSDVIYAGTGNDGVFGDVGDDIIYGGDGLDTLNGGTGSDVIYGEENSDTIFAELGDDLVFGGGLNDTVNLGAGDDTFYGQDGNDVAFGESGDDAFFLGFGNDTAFTGVGDDVAFGEEGGDTLIGDLGNDVLDGGAGGDVLNGGEGIDNLNGGADGDILIGGPGGDRLEGGAGGDLYWWQAQTELNDLVVGFNSAEDQLQFTGSQFGGFTAGSNLLNGSTFISSANPNPTGAVPTFLYNNVDGSLFFDPDGTGGAARVFVALFQGAPALTAGDFQFV